MATESTWENFRKLSCDREKIIDVMYYYLVEGGTHETVTMKVYGDFSWNYASDILQCYNLNGKNNAKYSVRRFKHTVYREDIEAFVTIYPHGIANSLKPGSGIELTEFLLERCKARESGGAFNNNMQSQQSFNNQYNQSFDQQFQSSFSQKNQQQSFPVSRNRFGNNNEDDYYSNDYSQKSGYQSNNKMSSVDDAEVIAGGIGACIVLFLVLALIFDWFGWRTAIITFILDKVVLFVYFAGMVIFAVKALINKVPFLENKNIIERILSVFIIGVGIFILIVLFYQFIGWRI